MDQDRTLARAHRKSLLGGALVAIAGLLAALALVYTNANGVGEVASQAQQQQHAESALGATSAARNAIGQALLLAGASDDPELVAAAIAEAEGVLAAMEERVHQVVGPAELEDALTFAVAEANAVLRAIATGDLIGTDAPAISQLTESFAAVVDHLVDVRDASAGDIRTAQAQSGTVATASRFMIAFLVPTLGVAIAFVLSRRQRKRDLLAAELQHERAVNKSKDQLIANLSHELRTPLTGIYTSALTMAEIGDSEPELTHELTDVIIEQSSDLTRMVEDLLVSAQADAGRLRFDLRPTAVFDLIEGMRSEFDRFDHPITYDIVRTDLMIDPGRFRQLLRNLVSNAAKYGHDAIGIRSYLDGDRFVIEVTDDGPGVPEEVADRMFERFVHRGDQPLIVGSVGLGLAISKVLANGMNGSIWYERRADTTVFAVDFSTLTHPLDPNPSQPVQLFDDEGQPADSSTDLLELDPRVTALLGEAGITTVAGLASTPRADLLSIKGIGQGRLRQIEIALTRAT